MNIHEYQAKGLLAGYGIPTPKGALVQSAGQIDPALAKLTGPPYVVKAQIHAGGRGKGGGVKLCQDRDRARQAAAQMLGMNLVTHQTGPGGKQVQRVWIEQGAKIGRELYLAVVLDRARECHTIMASPRGGMDIEEVAAKTPEAVFTTRVAPGQPVWDFQCRRLLYGCGLGKPALGQGVGLIKSLVRLAWEKEATLVEINPLVVTTAGDLLALDAKMNFDDSALKRNPDIAALADPGEADPLDLRAQEYGLNYIRLQGNVGTMVNGAGLAMATMDVIKLAGAAPANFLDVGGGANEQMVAKGFEIILGDPNVKAILINIFGGILRCDVLAAGVVAAAKSVAMKVPLVVRLEGTNVDQGREIMAGSGLDFEVAGSMAQAAQKIAAITGGGK